MRKQQRGDIIPKKCLSHGETRSARNFAAKDLNKSPSDGAGDVEVDGAGEGAVDGVGEGAIDGVGEGTVDGVGEVEGAGAVQVAGEGGVGAGDGDGESAGMDEADVAVEVDGAGEDPVDGVGEGAGEGEFVDEVEVASEGKGVGEVEFVDEVEVKGDGAIEVALEIAVEEGSHKFLENVVRQFYCFSCPGKALSIQEPVAAASREPVIYALAFQLTCSRQAILPAWFEGCKPLAECYRI